MNIFNKKSKGFTLIELLIVIVMLGILIILAMPRYKGYIEKAKLTRIKHDVKVMENKMEEIMMNNPKDWEAWDTNDKDLHKLAEDKLLFDTKGFVIEINKEHIDGINSMSKIMNSINDVQVFNIDVPFSFEHIERTLTNEKIDEISVRYKIIPKEYKNIIGTRLKGTFYSNKLGKIYYESDKPINSDKPDNPDGKPDDKFANKDDVINKKKEAEELESEDYENFGDVQDAIDHADKVIENDDATQSEIDEALKNLNDALDNLQEKPNIPDEYVLATDEDFEWIEYSSNNSYYATNENTKGFYKYIGNDEYVMIPHIIKGHPMTSYYKMFYMNNGDIKGIASTNKNINSMRYMFENALKYNTSLDLSSLDTSSVIDMSYMFRGLKVTSLDLSNFDTSNVVDMSYMFYQAQAISLDLSNFDTSNVINMEGLFYQAQAKSLDLSNFDTSSVTNMQDMFYRSAATSLILNSFDTSNVTNMNGMFSISKADVLDLSSFDTSNVNDMANMFYHQYYYPDLATVGYARTQTDLNRFNNSITMRPSWLTFVVKDN